MNWLYIYHNYTIIMSLLKISSNQITIYYPLISVDSRDCCHSSSVGDTWCPTAIIQQLSPHCSWYCEVSVRLQAGCRHGKLNTDFFFSQWSVVQISTADCCLATLKDILILAARLFGRTCVHVHAYNVWTYFLIQRKRCCALFPYLIATLRRQTVSAAIVRIKNVLYL